MTDSAGTVEVIVEFCELAIERRRRALAQQARTRFDALEGALRELIDGARPAPRKIEGHAAAKTTPPAAAAAAPAKQTRENAKPPSQSISDLVDKMELSAADQGKLKNEVRLED